MWLVFVTPGFEACRRHFGHDFLAFYAAGSLAREGRHADLYDLAVIKSRQQAIARDADLALGDAVGPWWNPPVYAWVFAPLSALSFPSALAVWCGVNLAAMGGAVFLLCRLVRENRGLIALLVLVSAPLVQALTHGQNTPISLLLVAAVAHAWRNKQDFAAGVLVGALMYKPQLAAALAAVLVLHRGGHAAAGLITGGAILFAATVTTMPGALSDYLHRMPDNLHVMQVEHPYLWERHVTLKAFWRLLVQGRGAGETSVATHLLTSVTALPFAAGLFIATWRARRAAAPSVEVLAATVATAPLLMPFYFDYDLLLLAVPAVLATRHLATWSALYLVLFVNPYVAPALRFNLAVPLLAWVAGSTLARAVRRRHEACEPLRLDDVSTPLAPSRRAA